MRKWTEEALWRAIERHRDKAREALSRGPHHTKTGWLNIMRADKDAMRHLKAAEALLCKAVAR